MQFLLAAAVGTIWNARRYRVAAPSIRIVPWAALASCWPLPQQLLPVSAAGGGRRRCTLRIFSGKNILNFGFQESLRTFLKPIFTGGVVTENGICSAAFCESAALRLASSPSQALTRQLSQRESLWRNRILRNLTGNFAAMPRPLPLGEVAANAVSRRRGRGRCRRTSSYKNGKPERLQTLRFSDIIIIYSERSSSWQYSTM